MVLRILADHGQAMARVAGHGQAPCRGGQLRLRSPARWLSAAAWATCKSGQPWPAHSQAAASLCRQAAYGQKLPPARAPTRRSTSRGGARGGAALEWGTDRKGSSSRPLARQLPVGKGSRRLRRGGGGGGDVVRVREEG
ncbi:hypothetical protein BHE74_00050625 [Ensete ventricosum]|nr:hypothetical protein BHE74_00050625 [Ensete ventricosum]RZS00398.1 hypothetical protein BHM03_00030095 [Ensete ventricosum]